MEAELSQVNPPCQQCNQPAIVEVEYGIYGYPMNFVKLCDKCSDELWKQSKAAVNGMRMHWVNRRVK